MISRHLDLWTGLLTSTFEYLGETVIVETCVDPEIDAVAARVKSPLLRDARLQVLLDFPAPDLNSPTWVGNFDQPNGHTTAIGRTSATALALTRIINDTHYHVALSGNGFTIENASPNRFLLKPDADEMEFTCAFSEKSPKAPSFEEVRAANATAWPAFWNSGGVIDLSQSRDPRWKELERRIVLSQYQLATQSAGDQLPAEVRPDRHGPLAREMALRNALVASRTLLALEPARDVGEGAQHLLTHPSR